MAITNHERVGRALKLLQEGLLPYFDREMKAKYGTQWCLRAATILDTDSTKAQKMVLEDLHSLLRVMSIEWKAVFGNTLGKADRNLLEECREIRNAWAHNSTCSGEDTYRALDSVTRFLTAISAPQAETIAKQKQELLRQRFEEQARHAQRRVATTPTEGQPQEGLKPWRDLVTPHPDVSSGQFQQAEFAADLWEVYLDLGSDEYRDPTEFYRRTYLTEGLQQLLSNALR
ncbi:MAG: Swt1 family HEPN domain-containing protein, partial [Prochlorothrix sp.]